MKKLNNIRLGKKTIAGIVGVLMITTALTLIFASGAIADQRGTLTDVTVDPSTSYIGESENYNFTFVTEQRIIGTNGDENIDIVQSDFDFDDITSSDVAVVYWSEAIDQYREIDPASVDSAMGYLNIELGLDGDNIAKDTELKVYLDEGDNEVQNPTTPGTYAFDITTYDSYNQEDGTTLTTPKALDTGSVDVEIAYQTEVTAGSVMAENADTTEWYASIKEALASFESLGAGDNIIVHDNYSGEPDSGALSWPIDVDIAGLTIRAADGAEPVMNAGGITPSTGIVNISASDVTIDGLAIENAGGTGSQSGIYVQGSDATVNNCTISETPWGIHVATGVTGFTLMNSTIMNFDNAGGNGLYLNSSTGAVIENNIIENGLQAMTVGGTTAGDPIIENNTIKDVDWGMFFPNDPSDATVQYNNFENAGYALQNEASGKTLTAESNWWNDPAGPLADGNSDDIRGDNFMGVGDFDITPWLDAPSPDGSGVDSIELDQDAYSGMDEVNVTARAGYKLGDDTLDVTVESIEAGETLTLTLEETGDSGVFVNGFLLTDNEDLYEEESGYLLVDNVEDTIQVDGLTDGWDMTATASVDFIPPVVDNIVVTKANEDSWLYFGEDNTWAENMIWARGSIEFTANFTENSPENMVFTIGEREIVEDLEAGDNSVTVSEYVSRIPDGTLPVTATLTDSGGLSDTLEKDIIVDTTVPDVTVVKPESVGFGPNVDNTEIPIRVDASDNVVDNIAGSGVETVTVDIPALENDISLAYDSESGYWENSITASVEDIDNFEITAAATDRMDLSSDTTATVAVLWDNTAPAIENAWVVYPEGFNAAKVGDTVIVKATVTDDVGVGSVWLNAENVGLDDEIEMTLVDGDVYSAELEDIDVAEENLGLRQLTVTALDTANNEATGIVDVNVVGYYESYEITLEKGWNLISLPIIPENTATEAVLSGFGDAVDNVVSVWGYDALDGQWMTYTPGVPTPPTFPSLRVMEDGKAYWVKMEETATLEIEGREMPVGGGGVIPPTYVLRTGWNLVGFTGVTQKTRDAYLGMVEEQVTGMTVFGYDTDKGLYTVRPSTMLTPGQGYWVFVTEKAAFTAW
ncbi:hypothetical protein AKJ39_03020 [candidate division MSBL1 archaeon SCGC-AAA259J03]|uniref:Right handed beta helix domain-containing protein n=1 Tax=candidate division MSBL1 archaeon SCGC-AAA259J03 TaxID=1698269 RepID=A0A656YYV0_9EURY|nr:hypothetical protein AKJ39_03020 [candidate division MSBL1 archaeon SCGC-AAA259J03]